MSLPFGTSGLEGAAGAFASLMIGVTSSGLPEAVSGSNNP